MQVIPLYLLWITSDCFTEMCHCFLLASHLSQSDTHGKCLPTAARSQRCLGAAGPSRCFMRAVHKVLRQPKTNWEAAPQCQFWNHFSQHFKLQLVPLHSPFPPAVPEENLWNQCQLSTASYRSYQCTHIQLKCNDFNVPWLLMCPRCCCWYWAVHPQLCRIFFSS